MKVYGILDRNDCHIDISSSLKATKRYATMNGYSSVSVRYNSGYHVDVICRKLWGKWVEVK